jgi:hypothetical protein
MDKTEKLHIEASAYAKSQLDANKARRLECGQADLDSLTESRIWVSAYEGYKAGYKAGANHD